MSQVPLYILETRLYVAYSLLPAGTLIAAVLRYESTIPVVESPLPDSFDSERQPLLNRSTSFPVNLFHLCLTTLFVIHLPLLILTLLLPRYPELHRIPAQDLSIPPVWKVVIVLIWNIPPQMHGLIFIHLVRRVMIMHSLIFSSFIYQVIAAAAHLRADGKDMWQYAEQWSILREKGNDITSTSPEDTLVRSIYLCHLHPPYLTALQRRCEYCGKIGHMRELPLLFHFCTCLSVVLQNRYTQVPAISSQQLLHVLDPPRVIPFRGRRHPQIK